MFAAVGAALEPGERARRVVDEPGLGRGAPDEAWLELAGREGLVAFTHDAKLRYEPRPGNALVAHGVFAVLVSQQGKETTAENIVSSLPFIRTIARGAKLPFICRLHKYNGDSVKVTILYEKGERLQKPKLRTKKLRK